MLLTAQHTAGGAVLQEERKRAGSCVRDLPVPERAL